MLKKKKRYNIAVAGATGVVGREMVQLLEERNFPVSECRLFASERTAGEVIPFAGGDLTVEKLTKDSFGGVDIALFSAGEAASREFAPAAASSGAVVIDNSAEWRMNPEVPLVVPEVNPNAVLSHNGIIANPNCSTIQLVVALKPLHDAAVLQRVIVSTYQSVSGTGKEAMEELMEQTKDLLSFKEVKTSAYPFQIAFNLLPHIGSFDEEG
ncbi:MAG TPA: aspartate-semialdehyde dehydrogenase, partial [Nitrospiria bacterium]|nr:aspartate-semialdehyde dehydrogenase [Nitrospiria bacterium]